MNNVCLANKSARPYNIRFSHIMLQATAALRLRDLALSIYSFNDDRDCENCK